MKKFDVVKWHRILSDYSTEAKAKGWCEQCQYPWQNGNCTCGNFKNPEVQEILKLFKSFPGEPTVGDVHCFYGECPLRAKKNYFGG